MKLCGKLTFLNYELTYNTEPDTRTTEDWEIAQASGRICFPEKIVLSVQHNFITKLSRALSLINIFILQIKNFKRSDDDQWCK